MPTTTYTVTYTRTHRPEQHDFQYTATAASATYAVGWSAETLSATGLTKQEARDNLRDLILLARGTVGMGDTIDVVTG